MPSKLLAASIGVLVSLISNSLILVYMVSCGSIYDLIYMPHIKREIIS